MSPPPEEAVPAERSDGSGEPNDPESTANEQVAEPGPWFALLRVTVGDRMPEGPLGPNNVPLSVLVIPVEAAMENLVQHARKCNNPRCPHVPAPLQIYRRMRPDAIRKAPGAREQVYKILWTQRNHELVRHVKDSILEVHTELAEAISSGAFSTGNRLQEVLDKVKVGEDGPPVLDVLAAVLWATEFKGKDTELLFRCVVALIEWKQPPRTEVAKPAQEKDDSKLLRSKYHAAIHERDRAIQTSEKLAKDLQLRDRLLDKAHRDLEDIQGKYNHATGDVDRLQRQLRDKDLAYRDAKRDGERAANSASALRRDLHEQQKTMGEFQATRAALALRLGEERRTIERLKLELAAVPRGSDAVNLFLREEEQRLDMARTISAGGDRVRADHDWTLYRKLKHAFLEAHPRYLQPAPVKVRAKTAARFLALGGAVEVGRSCYLLELGRHRIMVDCGIKPGPSADLHPQIEQLDHLDALILTHAHTDHIGWVPALVRRFPDIGIYCSKGTAALLPVMLEDCYKHYTRKVFVQRERAKYISNAAPVQELYDIADVQTVPSLVIKCSFNEEEGLPFGDVSLLFYEAGHILGAASVLLQDSTGRRIFFSGDFASFPQLTLGRAYWPDEIGEVDLLVLESTYGGRKPHRPLEDSRKDLVSFVAKTIEARGSVILASFGLGRAQELLKLIVTSMNEGALPRVEVYVDGLIKRINPIYRMLANFDVPAESFYEVTGETERQEVAISAQTRPSIIITTSGMLTGGPVLLYASYLLPDPRHRIVLTGYQDEGAPSRVLRDVAEGRRIVTYEDERGDEAKFEAAMPAEEVGLSAHADHPGLLEYAGKLRPRQIALVHGESSCQKLLREQLLMIHPKSDVICGPSDLRLL
jgi:Cft2 family RNA processing exonuclease